MFRANTKILLGVALIGSAAAVLPEAAIADGNCSSGSVALGGTQTFNYTLDSSSRAQFTLDTAATDVAVQIVDNSSNVVCQTALPNPGHQSCSWMPASGTAFSVNVLRPIVVSSTGAPAPLPAPTESANVGQGADTSGGDNGSGQGLPPQSSDGSQMSGGDDSGHHHRHHHHHDGNGGEADGSSGQANNAGGESGANDQASGTDSGNQDGSQGDETADDGSSPAPVMADVSNVPPEDFNLCYVQVN